MTSLLEQIEAFLEQHQMSATAFGIKALNDPGFVAGLRNGRDPKMSTARRCCEFMAEHEAEATADAETGKAA